MPINKEVRFLVKKETFIFKSCSSCQGIGNKKRTFQGNTFNDSCFNCKGTGREKISKITEITLLDALKELNLIK